MDLARETIPSKIASFAPGPWTTCSHESPSSELPHRATSVARFGGPQAASRPLIFPLPFPLLPIRHDPRQTAPRSFPFSAMFKLRRDHGRRRARVKPGPNGLGLKTKLAHLFALSYCTDETGSGWLRVGRLFSTCSNRCYGLPAPRPGGGTTPPVRFARKSSRPDGAAREHQTGARDA